jgi:hypothetical protein
LRKYSTKKTILNPATGAQIDISFVTTPPTFSKMSGSQKWRKGGTQVLSEEATQHIQ